MKDFILTTGIKNIEKDKFKNIKNDWEGGLLNKPYTGGLWASTFNENYVKDIVYPSSWYKFLINSGLSRSKTFGVIYKLQDSAKIFELDSLEKYNYLKENCSFVDEYDYISVDWEKLFKDYDAFHLSLDMFRELRSSKYYRDMGFYSWDCECYLISNLDCIDKDSIQYIEIKEFNVDD